MTTPRSRLPVIVAAALGLLIGAAVWDRVLAHHRPVYLVNGLPLPLTVELDGARVEVPAERWVATTLAEGEHGRVSVTATPASGEPIRWTTASGLEVRAGFADRWGGRTLLVLNPDAGAALLIEDAVYGPGGSTGPPTPGKPLLGPGLHRIEGVDLPFAPFPDTGPAGAKRRVSLVQAPPAAVLARWADQVPPAAALAYAQAHLAFAVDPASLATEELLDQLVRLASTADRAEEVERFLAPRVAPDARGVGAAPAGPGGIPWHRAYQEVVRRLGGQERLRETYGARLRAQPNDAAALYLAGRVAPNPSEAASLYRTATLRDPELAFAHHALAVLAFRRAEFAVAAEHAARAASLRPHDTAMSSLRDEARLAADQLEALARDLEPQQAERPLDLELHTLELALDIAAGDPTGAREEHRRFRERAAAAGEDPLQLGLLSELTLLDLLGDREGVLERAATVRDPERRARFQAQALLDLNRPGEAAPLLERGAAGPAIDLVASLVFARLGQDGEAQRWRDRARQRFAAGSAAERRVAELLEQPPTRPDPLLPLALSPTAKAVVLVTLAGDQPAEGRAAFLDLAARFNFRPTFPRHLLQRTIAERR